MDRRNRSDGSLDPVARAGHRRTDGLARGRRGPGDGAAYREARTELSQWLVLGREAKGLTSAQVAQITRIQLRTIERLESGQFDDLPADVFVRGFVRGYARCVGLPVEEALARYGSCGFAAAPVASAQAQALLDSMSSLTPTAVRSGPLSGSLAKAPRILGLGAESVEVCLTDLADLVDPTDAAGPDVAPIVDSPVRAMPSAAGSRPTTTESTAVPAGESSDDRTSKPKRRTKAADVATGPAVRDSRGRFIRRTGVMPVVDLAALGLEGDFAAAPDPTLAEPSPIALALEPSPSFATAAEPGEPAIGADRAESDEVVVRSLASLTAGVGRVTGRHVALPPRTSGIMVAPTPLLTIDDDDPEDAERAREARLAPRKDADKGWRSFLPPALLDQQRGRQGGLTLAVIILLIVATLTLSYLMRRPSSTGEGITERSAPTLRVVA